MKKQKLECCNCKTGKKETIKLYFCPKCRSKDVAYIFQLKNIFGLLPKMKCKKCGFEAIGFPIIIIDKAKLNKTRK